MHKLDTMQKPVQLTVANQQQTRWLAFDSQQAINETATARILQAAQEAIASRGRFLLVLAGLFSPSLPGTAKVFLLAPALYLTVVHALSVGSLRYRVPAEVPMAVIAAACVARVWESVRAPDWRRETETEEARGQKPEVETQANR